MQKACKRQLFILTVFLGKNHIPASALGNSKKTPASPSCFHPEFGNEWQRSWNSWLIVPPPHPRSRTVLWEEGWTSTCTVSVLPFITQHSTKRNDSGPWWNDSMNLVTVAFTTVQKSQHNHRQNLASNEGCCLCSISNSFLNASSSDADIQVLST